MSGSGARVTVLEAMDIPLRNVLGPMIGAHCGSLHGANGVELRTGVAVTGIRKARDRRRRVRTRRAGWWSISPAASHCPPTSSSSASASFPSTDWLTDSGLTLENGVVCDDRLFAADGIVSAGDIARWNWRHDGGEELIRIEHWQVAAEAGVAAARSMRGRSLGRTVVRPRSRTSGPTSTASASRCSGTRGGDDEVQITEGSLEEGKFVALFGRAGRLRAVMAIGKPRQLMGFRPLLHDGCSWDDALAHGRS